MVEKRQTRRGKTAAGGPVKALAACPVIRVRRGIRELTRLLLFVRAGARCEFDGCNDYLLEHPLTLTPGNFAQMAHIVAFQKKGPRGKSALRPAYINAVGNLMLLCPQCHKLIDDHPDQYTVGVLEKFKQAHEDRIFHVTSLGPDLKTSVVQLKARIAGHTVAIPVAQVTKAVAPRYPVDARGHLIDLTAINAEGKAFIDEACRCIKQKVERLYEPGMDVHETRHISLFALAPIPLLVYLGGQLSNKVPVDVFQRHRDTEDWVWKESGAAAEYRFHKIREGRGKVALILSLSGKIKPEALPVEIDEQFTVYELTLANMEPNPSYLRQRDDLTRFKDCVPGGAPHHCTGMRSHRHHVSFPCGPRSGRGFLRPGTSSQG
jgi:hypothetical protein